MANRENFFTQYDQFLNLDFEVKFVTIFDNMVTIIFGSQQESIQNFLSEEDQRRYIKFGVDASKLKL